MIDITKKYQTRDGRPVKILTTDSGDKRYPVVALVPHKDKDGRIVPVAFTAQGFFQAEHECPIDLVEIPEVKTFWVNVYSHGLENVCHETRELADEQAAKGRIACVKVEYKPGDGL